jgi:SpoVK/Ycf46/Vps4 family AAA+-type ATPase
MYIQKENRPHEELDYDELAFLTDRYVAADIETICDEVARDASKHILDLAGDLEGENFDETAILSKLESQKITMDLLKQAIMSTTSSLKMVDMNIYTEWLKTIEN